MRRWAFPAVLTSGLASFVALSLWHLDYPGLQYDELLFGNAALGGIDGTFLFRLVGGVPLFLMGYIGALKAWLYYPIFRLLGVSVVTVRLPMILATAAGLYFLTRTSQRVAGRRAALRTFLLLATNATFLWAAKVDHGPVVLGTLFEILAFGAFLSGNAAAFALFCVAGLFQKVVFLFWLGGFLPFAWWLYPERRRPLAMGAAAAVLYLMVWWVLTGGPPAEALSPGPPGQRLSELGSQLAELLDGSAFFRFAGIGQPWALPSGLAIAAAVGCGLWATRWRENRLLWLLAGQLLVSIAITFFVGTARRYWHFYGFLPWIYLALALSLSSWRRAGPALFLLFLGANLYGEARGARSAGEPPGNPHFTTAIYPLLDYCASLPDRLCASLSWGTHTQLEAFTWRGRAVPAVDPRREADPRFVYVDYDGLIHVNHEDSHAFLVAEEKAGREPVVLKRILEGQRTFFVIYDFRPVTSSSVPGSRR